MVFLTGLLQKIGSFLLPTLLNWVWERVSSYLERRKKNREIEEKNRAVREQLEKGETPEEREKAAEDVIKHF